MLKTTSRVLVLLLFPFSLLAQNEPFSRRTVVSGLNSPWEIVYGPNDSIWVTESVTYLVKRVHIANGTSTTLLNLSSARNFAPNDGGRWPQGGLMGMALHPNLYSADPVVRAAKPWVYLAYVYERITGQNCVTNSNSSNPCNFRTRIVRYSYNGSTLSSPVTVIDNMPGSNDHNSGRLVIGPDLKLYYTIGDMGAGQFNNTSRTNNAQALDVLEGKTLRLNSEEDGDAGADAWVPDDNPFYNGSPITPRDYVYSLGHRNAQGIVWAEVNGTPLLYNSEHGDKSDDEVNVVAAGRNFGWNRIAGSCDGNYNGLTLGGFSPVNENNFCSVTPTHSEPVKSLFTATPAQIAAFTGDFLSWPTVAPSSIDFYSRNVIPGWQNSLLVTCLKAGRVYRLKLNSDGTGVTSQSHGLDTSSLFRGQGRFRDLAIAPSGTKIFLACDASGQTSGPTGGFNGGGSPPPNAGSILEFTYTGTILPITQLPGMTPPVAEEYVRLYPNPVKDEVRLSIRLNSQKPYRIEVYSAAGILMKETSTTRNETAIASQDLKQGLYIVQIKNAFGKVLATKKFTKL